MGIVNELEILLKAQEKAYGQNHIKIASTLAAIADLLVIQDKLKEAEPYYWRIVKIRQKVYGQSNLDVASTLDDLAYLYEKQGNADEQERMLRWSCDIRKKVFGAGSPEFQDAFDKLRKQTGGFSVAPVTADGDLQAPSAVPLHMEEFSWDEHFDRGVELQQKGELIASEQLFINMVAVAKHFAPLTHYHACSLDHLARTYLLQGRYEESRIHFEQALAIFENTVGTNHIDTVECLEGGADAHAALGQPEQARFLYAWAVQISESKNFSEAVERIKGKLISLPFSAPKVEEEDEEAPVAAAAEVPSAPPEPPLLSLSALLDGLETSRKKTTAQQKKAAAPAPEIAGGLNAILDGVGSTPKRATGSFDRPSQNDIAAQESGVLSLNSLLEDIALPSKKNTATIMREVISAATLQCAEARDKSRESLDDMLQGVGPSKKKTTSTSLKKSAEQVPAPSKSDSADDLPKNFDAHLQGSESKRKKTTISILKPVDESFLAATEALAQPPVQEGDPKTAGGLKKPGSNLEALAKAVQKPDAPGTLRIGKGMASKPSKAARPWQKPSLGAKPNTVQPGSVLRKADADWSADGGVFSDMAPHFSDDPKEIGAQWQHYSEAAHQAILRGHRAEAERLLILALEQAEQFGDSDHRLWQTELELAQIYEADRKHVRAGHLYRSLLQSIANTLGPTHPDVVACLERLGQLYIAQERWDEAEKAFQQILQIHSTEGNEQAMPEVKEHLANVQRLREQRS